MYKITYRIYIFLFILHYFFIMLIAFKTTIYPSFLVVSCCYLTFSYDEFTVLLWLPVAC